MNYRLQTYANRCFYCETPFDELPKKYTKTNDHVFPMSRGGKKKGKNIVLCCYGCNHKKGNLTPSEFYEAVALNKNKFSYSLEKQQIVLFNIQRVVDAINAEPRLFKHSNQHIESVAEIRNRQKAAAQTVKDIVDRIAAEPSENFHEPDFVN